MRVVLMTLLSLLASGCLARTALNVVTLPVKVAGKAVDLATTSKSEADRNRDRDVQKADARAQREQSRRENGARDHQED